jgi:hypothetical protein
MLDLEEKQIDAGAFEDQPDETDGFISDIVRGGYDVSLDQTFLEHFNDRDEAENALKAKIKADGFYPNCWFVDDHGGYTLISVDSNGMYWQQD